MMEGVEVVVVHGGAGVVSDDRAEACRVGVKRAAAEGARVLAAGGSAMDAVEAAVVLLEDDPNFNAGVGSVLNAEGDVEQDALVMDGSRLAAGAVSCVRNIANPVLLARLVMDKTSHAMLTGSGAAAFARSQGVPEVPAEQLETPRSRQRWEKNRRPDPQRHPDELHGTVGAVARDRFGNLACATSTGGMTNKMVGRVGDTPCIGSGGYADNQLGAVSTTGDGESIMRVVLARLVLFNVQQGMSLEEAADSALSHMTARVGGTAGLVLLAPDGRWAARFNSLRMSWAAASPGAALLHYGLERGEILAEPAPPMPLTAPGPGSGAGPKR
ncbi:isoaspartyl peptidase/L-asparaginase [Lampetra fluviatilis]